MIEVYAEDEALTAEEEECIRTACETALEIPSAYATGLGGRR